jgi:predicted nucleic acid-binding Zn ribbon protein
VLGAWSTVAGESVCSHTTGAHLRRGELVVYVDSPVWATELSALSEPYRVAINENWVRKR